MKIIHTYLKTNHGGGFQELIFQYMLLSTILAKKHYGKIELYTNEEGRKLVEEFEIPYTKINSMALDNIETNTFSIPKLITYSLQNESYLHIDLDCFLFNKLPELSNETIWGCFPELKNDTALRFQKNVRFMYDVYIKSTYEIQDRLPEEFLEHVKFQNVMNMCVFGGHQYDLISNAARYCLKIYWDNKDFFDADYYKACIIEQLFIPAAVRMQLHDEGKNYDDKSIFQFYYEEAPTILDVENGAIKYPSEITSLGKSKALDNIEDLFRSIHYDFNGFLHLNGYKGYQEMLFLIKQILIEKYDELDKVERIAKKFDRNEKYKNILKEYLIYIDKINNKTKRLFYKS